MRWVVLAVVLLLTPLVQAAPVPTGDVEFHFYRDLDAGEYVVTPQADAPYSVGFWGNDGTYADGGRDWKFMFVDQDGPFRLDTGGQIAVTVYVGGGVQEEVVPESGVASVGWQLVVAGEEVASGDEKGITYSASAEKITWSVAAPDATIEDGSMLRIYTTAHTGLGARMDLEPSSLVLPVLEGAEASGDAPVAYRNITGETFGLDFTDATEIHHLNWTVAGEGLVISWHVRNGSLDLTVTSPANETMHDGRADGTGNLTAAVEDSAGVWRVTLHASNLTGNVTFAVAAVAQEEGEGPGPHGTHTSTPDPSGGPGPHNATGDGTLGGGAKESPGLPLLLIVAGLVAAVRRRP